MHADHHHLRPPWLHRPRKCRIQGKPVLISVMYVTVLFEALTRTGRLLQGKFTFSQDDEMLVKVEMKQISRSDARAAAQLQESLSLKMKGIDGAYSGVGL